MRKIIAAINMTLDGVCDHTALSPGEEIHDHYTNLLRNADSILYGRITYELMQYWQTLVKNPSGDPSMDDFAMAIDQVPKIIFSHTLDKSDPVATGWDTARLARRSLEEEVLALKQSSEGTKSIFVGSRSLIVQLLQLNLLDELQLCVHPILAGAGSRLFENLNDRAELELANTKIFAEGAVILYYKPKEVRRQ